MSRGTRTEARYESMLPREVANQERPGAHGRLPDQSLSLPRSDRREPVYRHARIYQLRGSEVRTLATVGAFRIVPASDLDDGTRRGDPWNGDLRSLADQGLLERKTVMIEGRSTLVVALTRDAKSLLDAHRRDEATGRQQCYHAGFVKPREMAHDAQLYRLYRAEAARIEAAGGRISRVVLDYELKREYQRFLNRKGREEDSSRDEDRRVFAEATALPVVNGHLALPDLRIEYETADGRHEHRDVELVTRHYSRAQLAGKAVFAHGSPFDPHNLDGLS